MIIDSNYFDYDPAGFDLKCKDFWSWTLPLNKETRHIKKWCFENLESNAEFITFDRCDGFKEIGVATKNRNDAILFTLRWS
jgi:hypothetical protein